MSRLTSVRACLLWGAYLGQIACLAHAVVSAPVAGKSVYIVRPSQTDPAIRHFDEPHYVVSSPAAPALTPLVVFLAGTNGKPANVAHLLNVVATQGYRVVGLEYNDAPAIAEICPDSPVQSCAGDFRRKRIFGDDVTSVVIDTPAESIVNRLVKLLIYLQVKFPEVEWTNYLRGDAPNWSRIVISGVSQGAGMAAYIAKHELVARVVLFSGPWDSLRSGTLAPWLSDTGVTPPDKWFAAYHRRENTASSIVRAYYALGIPAQNITVFTLDLPDGLRVRGARNPFHSSTVKLPGYEPQWRSLFGHYP